MTNFEKITETPEALGEFLASLPVATGPWDEEFHRTFCDSCELLECRTETCPHNHVQILTKGSGICDFDLLDGGDWYGVTISCGWPMEDAAEPGAVSLESRLYDLEEAKRRGINTWVSFEPVLDPAAVLDCIKGCAHFIDRVKIGKLNYHPSDIDWARFGREAVAACEEMGLEYYIKDSLRTEMDKP